MTPRRTGPPPSADVPPGVVVHFDGACQPPRGGGVATYGFTVEGALEHEGRGLAVRPGAPHATNNVAEYVGAICALEWLVAAGYAGPVELIGDSQLVIEQTSGRYAVHAPHLAAYRDRLTQLGHQFADLRLRWVPREENRRADELSKVALEEALSSGTVPAPRSTQRRSTRSR